jgi:YggT family protein
VPTGYLTNPLFFIITTLASAYIFVLIIRILLQFSGADSRNPVSRFIIKITRPPLKILNPVCPTVKDINLAAIVVMIGLQMLIGWISFSNASVMQLFIWSLTELVNGVINVFIFSIFITIVLSWINPGAYHPIIGMLDKITEPVLKPFQRIIPPMGGLDLSPMAALISLQVLKMLLIPPLMALM